MKNMKYIAYAAALMLLVVCGLSAEAAGKNRRVQVAGIAFYNFENLFDTIPNNPLGRDEEFTPAGSRQWNSRKYNE